MQSAEAQRVFGTDSYDLAVKQGKMLPTATVTTATAAIICTVDPLLKKT